MLQTDRHLHTHITVNFITPIFLSWGAKNIIKTYQLQQCENRNFSFPRSKPLPDDLRIKNDYIYRSI